MVLGKVAAVSGTLMGVALIYRYVPAEKQDWSAIVPDWVMLFFVLWNCVVALFQFYVQSFSYYRLEHLGAFGVGIVILLFRPNCRFYAFTRSENSTQLHRVYEVLQIV